MPSFFGFSQSRLVLLALLKHVSSSAGVFPNFFYLIWKEKPALWQCCMSDSLQWQFCFMHLTCEPWGWALPASGPSAADWLQRSSPRSSQDSPRGSSVGFCSSLRSRLTLLLCWHEFYSVDTSIHAVSGARYTSVCYYTFLSPSGESHSSLPLESILLSAHGNEPLLSYWLCI